MRLLTQILILYNWGVVCVLLLFLYAIARFFGKRLMAKTNDQKGQPQYRLVLIPILFFIAGAVIYAFFDVHFVGNVWADSMRIIGGLVLGFAGYSLLNSMMGGRS